ncbi:hypothetical protein NW762_014710 [Fusarium torreyae]|uniref:Secreted protein n=1 Tax=Fusarium torreyae TaxID=1237075 RepID=A0A9W8V7J3_9HYPO|nr:hypothetical protein NW762_014710 [Fusarium torreyae]
MHISTALVSLILLLGSEATAKCITSGLHWSSKDKAVGRIEAACRGGVFKGTFKPKERKYLCVRGGENVKYEFSITNQNDQESFDLRDEHCMDGLSKEVWACDQGGITSTAGWEFSSDPNIGYCN